MYRRVTPLARPVQSACHGGTDSALGRLLPSHITARIKKFKPSPSVTIKFARRFPYTSQIISVQRKVSGYAKTPTANVIGPSCTKRVIPMTFNKVIEQRKTPASTKKTRSRRSINQYGVPGAWIIVNVFPLLGTFPTRASPLSRPRGDLNFQLFYLHCIHFFQHILKKKMSQLFDRNVKNG